MKQYDAIIIGAGPAGMMAAIRAAGKGRNILLLEKNEIPGRKLLITGNGRCNFTNSCDLVDFLEKFSPSGEFLRNAFARFFNTDLVPFFKNSGIKLKTEKDGRIFPQSGKSKDILDALRLKLTKKNIKVICSESVREIITKDKNIAGITTHSDISFSSTHVVIATGGKSYSKTGSTGDGYALAEKLGHRIIPLKPALAPIVIKDKFITEWQGIALKDIKLTLLAAGKKIAEKTGEIVFTHFGLSGPEILDLSASAYDYLESKNKVEISLNFRPALNPNTLDAELLAEFKTNPNKSLRNIFKTLLPQGIINGLLGYCKVDPDKNVNQVALEERKMIVKGLLDLRLEVKNVMPLDKGMVTRGGVDTKQINPQTMESKLIKGLFFAGEVIDVDAQTGGYNLQAAFSTGWICGENI